MSFMLNSIPLRRLLYAGLFILMTRSPVAAQPTNEFVVGGGFHAGFAIGDFIQMPAVPSVDVRLVRWTSAWGVSGRVMVGLGSGHPDEPGVVERRHPMYFQVLLRYRTQEPDGNGMHVGIGGGVMTYGQTGDLGYGDGRTIEEFKYGGVHILAVEALRSIPLGDRLSLKIGATMVLPVHVHPVMLFAWKL